MTSSTPWRSPPSNHAPDSHSARTCPTPAPARAEHDQGPDPMAAALLGDLGHRGRRYRDHRQVNLPGQVIDRCHAGHSLRGRGVRIDRVDRTGEAAGHDVVQDGPAHAAAAAARAYHRDRPRLQQRAQAGHIRPAFPARHRFQVIALPVFVLAGGQGEAQLGRTVCKVVPDPLQNSSRGPPPLCSQYSSTPCTRPAGISLPPYSTIVNRQPCSPTLPRTPAAADHPSRVTPNAQPAPRRSLPEDPGGSSRGRRGPEWGSR